MCVICFPHTTTHQCWTLKWCLSNTLPVVTICVHNRGDTPIIQLQYYKRIANMKKVAHIEQFMVITATHLVVCIKFNQNLPSSGSEKYWRTLLHVWFHLYPFKPYDTKCVYSNRCRSWKSYMYKNPYSSFSLKPLTYIPWYIVLIQARNNK